VVYDYRAGKKADLAPWMVSVLRIAALEEQDNQRKWAARRGEVEGWVSELESGSWASGKPEDMGQ
jgi:hypothetical protein